MAHVIYCCTNSDKKPLASQYRHFTYSYGGGYVWILERTPFLCFLFACRKSYIIQLRFYYNCANCSWIPLWSQFFYSLLSSVSQCLPYLAPAEICPVILIKCVINFWLYNMLFYTSCSNNLFHSFGQLLCSLPLASQVFMSELDIQIPTAFGMIVIVFCFSVALGLQACNAWNTSNLL